MRKILGIIFLFVFFITSFVSPKVASAACSIEILTPLIEEGQPVQLRITGIPYTPGDQFDNHHFTISSPATGKWVDVGNSVIAAGDGTLTISVLNDNDGNPIIPPGFSTEGYALELWQSQPLDFGNFKLCSSFPQTVRVVPAGTGGTLNQCASCGPGITGECKAGLFCSLGMCLPVSDSAAEGAPCFNDSQCLFEGFVCENPIDAYSWCASNPAEGTLPPGRCTEPPPTEATFNCSNRGGQCPFYTNATCVDGKKASQCGSCWINPNSVDTGVGFDPTLVGSCVTKTDDSCGLFGNNCCLENNTFTCSQGTPSTTDPNYGICICEGGDKGLGQPCQDKNECKSNKCINQKCAISDTSCVYFGEGTPSESFCESVGGIACTVPAYSSFPSRGYCCPTIDQCVVAGGKPGTNFDAYCGAKDSIKTAIGCIPFTAMSKLVAFFITWGIGIVGGFGMLLIIYAGIQIITSGGDPSRLQSGKELLTSALTGVAMLIFSIFILRLIGVNVLGLF